MSNLVKWEPFRDLISLREAMDRLFEESFVRPRAGWPRPQEVGAIVVDMYETDEAVVVKAALPGVKAEDLDISLTGDTLTIRGETEREGETQEENYLYRERYFGAFSRSLALPKHVVSKDAEAEFENGVLVLTLPKAEEVKPKAIKVKTRK